MTLTPADLQRRRFLRDSARYAMLLAAGTLPLASSLAGASTGTTPTASLATVRGGRLRGRYDQGVHRFLGVPYGADTATRRFQPALPELPW
uniref:carboxylesterase family protein n=1 Tax=Pseudomonas viridiflava TaxID=33069 RepID=UPI0013C2FB79